jgi:GDP-D-mannose dehydratase
LKETRILITNENKTSENFNYIVSIRGFKFNTKKIIIHRVSLTDKNYKNIHLSFMDIIYDLNTPNSFVRMIDNTQYVYDNGKKVLSQKRKKAQYFTNTTKCKSLSENFITMDLETKSIEGVLEPYCVSIFDGKTSK